MQKTYHIINTLYTGIRNRYLGILISTCLLVALILLSSNIKLEPIDLNNYMKGILILIKGGNPYENIEFFAPPWFALIFGWMLILPHNLRSILWLLGSVISIFALAAIIIQWFGKTLKPGVKIFFIIAATIMPASFFCYITGQISPIIALTALCMGYMVSMNKRINWLLAFFVLVITLKPHIVFLLLFLCVFTLLRQSNWETLLWISAALFLSGLISYLLLQNWFIHLIMAWIRGSYKGGLPGLVAEKYVSLRDFGVPEWIFLVILISVIWIWWKTGFNEKVISLALPAGLIIIPYSRSYDFVVLIPAVLYLLTSPKYLDYVMFGVAFTALLLLPLTQLSILTPVIILLVLLIKMRCKEIGTQHNNKSNRVGLF